mmetsp:Transcript_19638/g.47401  ORF Transcript_19638/g.47401 Transcript_19638/m.47401 type:complete len:235 (+) Transcript_19638:735-1439(+)
MYLVSLKAVCVFRASNACQQAIPKTMKLMTASGIKNASALFDRQAPYDSISRFHRSVPFPTSRWYVNGSMTVQHINTITLHVNMTANGAKTSVRETSVREKTVFESNNLFTRQVLLNKAAKITEKPINASHGCDMHIPTANVSLISSGSPPSSKERGITVLQKMITPAATMNRKNGCADRTTTAERLMNVHTAQPSAETKTIPKQPNPTYDRFPSKFWSSCIGCDLSRSVGMTL